MLAFPRLSSTSPGFVQALEAMASRLDMDANAIAGVISLESGFNPAAVNPISNATGLIQFMPATAAALGTSVDALRQMSDIDQLAFVEKYFRAFAGRLVTRGDYYLAVFMPKFVGKPDTDVISTKGQKVYDQNKVLDGDKDGVLTVGDVRMKLLNRIRLAEGQPEIVPGPGPLGPSGGTGAAWAIILGIGAAVFVGTVTMKKKALA
jgi:hypothetical protein